MAHTIPNSISNFSPSPGTYVLIKKTNFLARYSFARKITGRTLHFEKYGLPLSTSVKLFPQFQSGCNLQPKLVVCEAFATGADVAVEESNLSQVDVEASANAETKGESTAKSKYNTTPSKRSRSVRKSEMPPVKNEELVPGATFTGKVRSIQPFGAFVDFGAFSDGLVHVSQLSDSFVKDVANVVTVGQEVKVRLVEANIDAGRISLSMRESNDPSKQQQQKDGPISDDKSRPPRKIGQRNTQKKDEVKRSKFVKGQVLVGTVKNLTKSGAFISLPEGEEGFLPTSEEADEGFASLMGNSSLEVEQEVNVRVLRISRGKITLTMKKEEAAGELDSKLRQGVVHTATNPFALAFRSNKEISSFLDERKKDEEPEEDALVETKDVNTVSETDGALSEALENEEGLELIPDNSQTNDVELGSFKETEASSGVLGDDISPSNEDLIAEEPAPVEATEIKEAQVSGKLVDSPLPSESTDEPSEKSFMSPSDVKGEVEANISGEVAQGTLLLEISEESVDVAAADALSESNQKSVEADTEVPSVTEGSSELSEEPSGDVANVPLSESQEVVGTKANDLIEPSAESNNSIPATSQEEEVVASDSEEHSTENSEHEVTGQTNVNGIQAGTATEEEKSLEVSSPIEPISDSVTEATATAAKATTISSALVKQLREETGAGMMDCKKALSESGGDIVKAQEYLRKKGLASADKKASRATAEGRIGSYIHDSRIGVLIEVNCETDFVARGDIFKELVDDLAMQIAACPQVQYVTAEDIPPEIVNKEKEIEMQKEDLLSKPEQIRSKIVDGRVKKRLDELGLLEQLFIKDDKVVVKDWVKQTISTIGENIKVKRFVRYNLGEGLEKRSHDFAAEVAAQTVAKSVPTPVEQEPAAAEVEVTVEKPEKASISAALVKKLREETGAGMMDCKKALSETGGDYEKAQEYLRKKGLSSADKKSSRLAAEGRIGTYLHDSRIGVLIEVNCETDFVGRSQPFKEFADDLAMQVVAFPQVQYVSIEDIPESIINKEKQLEMLREDLQSKPKNIREKIVEGRITKRLGELALLEQPFIKNDSVLVKDLVKQTVATLGENIKIRRFTRFTLGEAGDAKLEPEA